MFGRKKKLPADWYPDENDSSLERYWCGDRWTTQTRPVGSKTRGGWEPEQGSNALWLPDHHDPRFDRYWDGYVWTEQVRLTSRVKRLHKKSERSRNSWQESNAHRMDEIYGHSQRRELAAIERDWQEEDDRVHKEEMLRHAIDMMRGRRGEQAADVARAVTQHFTDNGWTELHSVTLDSVSYRGMVTLTAAGMIHSAPVVSDHIRVQLSWPAPKSYNLQAWNEVRNHVEDAALDLCLNQLNPPPVDGLVPAVEPTPATMSNEKPASEPSPLSVAEGHLATSLRVAAGRRQIRTLILAHTGAGNAIADLRFTDGTSQTVKVTQRLIVDALAGGNQAKIEGIRSAVLTHCRDRPQDDPAPAMSQRRVPATRGESSASASRPATGPTPSEQLLIDSRQREWDRRRLTSGQYREYETSPVDTDWKLWMRWTQPSSLPYKQRVAAELAAEERDAASDASAEAKRARVRHIDDAVATLSAALADVVTEWSRETGYRTMRGFTSLHFTADGAAYVYPRTDDGSHWPPGPRLVPLMSLVDEEVRKEFANTWRAGFKAFEALAVDQCQRRLREELTQEAPAAAARLDYQTKLDATKNACAALAATLSTAAAGRAVARIILSPAGSRRGVADVRFTDGTSHIAEVTDPMILTVIRSGDRADILDIRFLIEGHLIPRADPNDDDEDDWKYFYPSSQND